MDNVSSELAEKVLTDSARRRDALGTISAAGMFVLATLGLAQGSDAKKNTGGKHRDRHRNQAE